MILIPDDLFSAFLPGSPASEVWILQGMHSDHIFWFHSKGIHASGFFQSTFNITLPHTSPQDRYIISNF